MIYSITKWIGLGVTLVFLFFYFKGGFDIIQDIKRSIQSTKSIRGSLLLSSMTLIGLLVICFEFLICIGRISIFQWIQIDWVALLGIISLCLIIAVILYFRFVYLKKNWSANVNLIGENEIVKSGPYHYVRHPLYSIALLLYLSLFIVFGSWPMLICCLLMMAGYICLAMYEDHFLAIQLENYKKYQMEVRFLLIPYLV